MGAIHPELFRQAVSTLLSAGGFQPATLLRKRRPFDFMFEDRAGRRTAIRVSADKPPSGTLADIADHLKYASDDLARFLLITPKSPGRMQKAMFGRTFKGVPVQTDWLGGTEVSDALGLGSGIDLTRPETLDGLQIAAMTTHLEKYLDEPTPTASPSGDLSQVISAARRRITEIPPEYLTLKRQFPFSTIQRLRRKARPLDEQLLIGGHIEDVTVVLSDLKNFSTLVTMAGEEPLKRVMSGYYRRARELVWRHGGVLDKFIGDAVLAIFNYPYMSKSAPMRAIAFARDLIALGEDALGRLSADLDNAIDTGTRVGICSGELWILDIGQDEIEVSFFGDTINLAARLEQNAEVDGLLMDDQTCQMVRAQDPGLLDLIQPRDITLPPAAVKGQSQSVLAWQVPFAAMAEIEIVVPRELQTADA
ncbi:MAG: adenylate/guanylate cyclase domain-containing protein [Alphaproteobacteria bacterium]|nr:adenylate/guanylate cyclase domain-containing protein [Alphaproteobacteria bacterium]